LLGAKIVFFVKNVKILIKCRHTGRGRKIWEINDFTADNEIRFDFLNHSLL